MSCTHSIQRYSIDRVMYEEMVLVESPIFPACNLPESSDIGDHEIATLHWSLAATNDLRLQISKSDLITGNLEK